MTLQRSIYAALFFVIASATGCSCDSTELMGNNDGAVNGNTNGDGGNTAGDGGNNTGGDGGNTAGDGGNNTGGDGGNTTGGDGGNTTGGDGGNTTGGDGGSCVPISEQTACQGKCGSVSDGCLSFYDCNLSTFGSPCSVGICVANVCTNMVNDAGNCVPLGYHCGTGIPCQCENCTDDDGANDGVAVGSDPECTSYLDNDESSFATGIPGDNRDCAQDCFFDGNSGGGGNDCQVPTACIVADINDFNARSGKMCKPLDPNPGTNGDCVMSQTCRDLCLQYVPNGCDCYGCCSVLADDGMTYDILVGSPCDVTQLMNGNYGNCIQCVPNVDCQNTCGRCELCPGKTLADLPPDCFPPPPVDAGTPDLGVDDAGNPIDAGPIDTSVPDAGTPMLCEGGLQVCDGTAGSCPAGYICFFGCCLVDTGG